MPGFDETYENEKKDTFYEIYARPTTQWKHSCETSSTNKITRSDALKALSDIIIDTSISAQLVISKNHSI